MANNRSKSRSPKLKKEGKKSSIEGRNRNSKAGFGSKKVTKTRAAVNSNKGSGYVKNVSVRMHPKTTKAIKSGAQRMTNPKKIVKRVANTIATKNKKVEPAQHKRKAKPSINIPSIEDSRRVLDTISSNQTAVNYITKNISRRVLDVLNLLETPKSDEEIAQTLDMKINAVRRILNIAQEYGITNYYVTKNTNGWLSFAWYINANKLPYFLEYINSNNTVKSVINDDCNDYFICKTCYGKDKVVFTFDAAFENEFKCNVCGTDFVRMDREEAKKLIYPSSDEEKSGGKLTSSSDKP
ncbi:MAG: hypothetical protein M1500_02555 [Candidatus Marsarchaeota archaeon]|jgi:transcription initiation factor IIE alpha subunit|nr:hypothetical protein [Candidatus Marsarchaeota archaeon]